MQMQLPFLKPWLQARILSLASQEREGQTDFILLWLLVVVFWWFSC